MAQDPWEAALARRKQQAAQSDPWAEALARRKAAQSPAPSTPEPEKPSRFSRGLARAAAQGLTFGFGEEIEALPYLLPGGETREEALKRIRGEMKAYSSEYPGTALAAELAGGLVTGVAGGGRVAARMGLSKVGQVVGNQIGQGAISGFGGAEGDIASRLKGAAIGATAGAVLPYAGGQLIKKVTPAAKQIGAAAERVYAGAQRRAATGLERAGMTRAARMVEPTDLTRIMREASEALPGSTTGPVPSSLAPVVAGKSQAVLDAEQALAAARTRVKGATRAVSERELAGQEARNVIRTEAEQAKTAAERTRIAKQQQAAQTEAIGKGRAARLQTAATEAEQAAQDEAQRTAEDIARRLRAEPGKATQLQEEIRKTQLQKGEESYRLVRQVGAPPEPDASIYNEIFGDSTLRRVYNEAIDTLQREAQSPEAVRRGAMPLRTIAIDGDEVSELTLAGFDQMRRRVMESVPAKGPNAVGLSASQRNAAIDQINRLEQRYLAGFGDDVAAQTLRNARAEYRADFKLLEALQDGMNFNAVRAGKAAGLLKRNRMELDEVVKRVNSMEDAERVVFQAGARDAVTAQIRNSPDDALRMLRKLSGSETGREKLRLAYGDETLQELEALATASQSPARAARARALAERAQKQAAERGGVARTEATAAEQARTAAAQQERERLRALGAPVREARRAKAATEVEAARLAEELETLRKQQNATQRLPVQRAINQALGSSTQQQEFLQNFLPRMTAQEQQVATVIGSNVQRELQDMTRAGKSPQEILERIRELRQNDVVRKLFGNQMDAYARSIMQPSAASRVPGAVQPALAGYLSRRFAPKESRQ